MSPDFARLLPGVGREFSHSILGVFVVDTPLAIVLAAVATLLLVPRAARLPGLQGLARPSEDRIAWHWLALAALVGGATHLGWDLFTHGDHQIFHGAFLDRELADTAAGPFRVRQLAWPLHSLAGLIALAIAGLLHLRRSRTPLRSFFAPPWLRMAAIALVPLVVIPIEHPIRRATLAGDLAMILHSNLPLVRLGILASGLGLLGMFLFETRSRKRASPAG